MDVDAVTVLSLIILDSSVKQVAAAAHCAPVPLHDSCKSRRLQHHWLQQRHEEGGSYSLLATPQITWLSLQPAPRADQPPATQFAVPIW